MKQNLMETGRMDGRFDGQTGVFDPALPDRDYRDAYGLAHAESTAVRERANARLNFSAGYAAAKSGEDYETALRRLGLDQYRRGPVDDEQDAYCAPHDGGEAEEVSPQVERVRLARERFLAGQSVEQVLAADEKEERGRWGSGVYGCGYGDDWSQTLKEVFGEVLGEGWWEQVCAEAEARQNRVPTTQCGPGPNSYYK